MIRLTPNAIKRVRYLQGQQKEPNRALRIGIKGGGCSGMSYVLDLQEPTPKENDKLFEQEGIKILVDEKSNSYLEGLIVDYKESLMGGSFDFENPQAKKSCGCGTSFSV